jgi:Uma2 family endonuclease
MDTMSTIAPATLITIDELLAMPENGTERWLIRGKLWEKPMTKRNRFHAAVEARVAQLIGEWLDNRSGSKGNVYSGEVGCILSHEPSTSVGIDVAYFSADVLSRQSQKTTIIDGIPVLAVEILSPNDTTEEIEEKVGAYLDAGVPLVWIISPVLRTVQVFRPDAKPTLFNDTQEVSGEPLMPGFRIPVAKLFAR